MFKYVILTFLVASSAVSASLPSDYTEPSSTIDEYVSAFFKVTGQGQHLRESTGKVQPENIKIRLYSSFEDVFNGTLKDWMSVVRSSQFNTSLETKFFIHGWLEHEYPLVYKRIASLYAYRGNRVNFITVDWSEYSHSKDFSYLAQEVVPKIAEYLAPMVEKVMSVQKNNRVHLIGFDMGAHMAGIVGKRVHGTKIARITGLSPAGRKYNELSDDRRLVRGDAEYVDVIHTNMGGAGIAKYLGDVDFLPNNGRHQPAAENITNHAEKDVISHLLARYYYVESIHLGFGGFVGKKCESFSNFLSQKCALHESEVMGEPVSQKVNGTIYMTVNREMKPYFSRGIYGIYPYPEYPSYSTSTVYTTPTN